MLQRIRQFYKTAKRTSLLAENKASKKWFHLFSVIELLPEDEYPYGIPSGEWKHNCVRTQQQKLEEYTFYLSVDEMADVDEAIKVFKQPYGNYKIDGVAINFFNSTFINEPMGEYPLVLAPNVYKDDGLASVIPQRESGCLLWCKIDSERNTEKRFITPTVSREMLAIQELTTKWLGFDLLQKKEHLGNIYLSAPNPYFRKTAITLSVNPIGIFYRMRRRKGVSEPLLLRIVDKHGDAVALDKTYSLENSTGLIELPHEPHVFELRFYNGNGDLVALHDTSAFVKSIQIGASVKQADFHVEVETKDGSREFVVEKFSKPEESSVGEAPAFNRCYYFKNAEKEREYIALANKKEFIFYPGAKTEMEKSSLKGEARKAVREILNKARATCYICDPYFGSMDIIDFAFYVQNSGVSINIMNCKEQIAKEEARKIVEIIETYNEKPFGKIAVRTLRGKGILHDRFIVADTNVWFLGSSFNEFGCRATCIAKVPESAGANIVREIEKWFTSDELSQDIAEYAAE